MLQAEGGPSPAGSDSMPVGLQRQRHVDLRHRRLWPRRVVITALTGLVVLALLNVFGQRAETTIQDAPHASLSVQSPERLRGGLVFTTQIIITAHDQLANPRLLMSPDWFRGMTLNAIAPQPSNQESTAQGVVFDFNQLNAGDQLPLWISWQVNPVSVGARSDDLVLYDGQQEVLAMHRNLTIFP